MLTPRISPNELISDISPDELPPEAVNSARNVVSVDGALRQALPFESRYGSLLFPPRWLLGTTDGVTAWLLYCAATGIAVSDGATQTDLTPVGFVPPVQDNPFTGGIINQLPVVNTGAQPPLYWDHAALTMLDLPGWPAGDRARVVRPFREYLIAMGIETGGVTYPDLLRWSDAAPPGDVPQDWTASPTSDAGEASVSFNPGELVDGRQLVDRFYVYKTGSTYVLQYVAGAFVFTQRPIFSTVGLLTSNCVVEYRGRHICLTDGDVVAHDGVTVESLVSEKIRREIFDNLDGDNFENSYLALDPERRALFVCRPRAGEKYPSEAFVLNLEDGRASHQALNPNGTAHIAYALTPAPATAGGDTWATSPYTWANTPNRWNTGNVANRTADKLVLADISGQLAHELGAGGNQGGLVIEAELRRQGIALDPEVNRVYVRRLWLSSNAPAGTALLVSVGATDDPDAEPQWSPEQAMVVDDTQFINVNGITGRYVAYRIRAVGQQPWRLNSVRMEYERAGRF